MWTSHRDVERASDQFQVPGRTQCRRAGWTTFRRILARLLSCPRDRFDGARLEIDATYQVVFGIGDVETIAGERETLRTIESRFVESTVSSADVSRADGIDECAIEFGDDDAIVV